MHTRQQLYVLFCFLSDIDECFEDYNCTGCVSPSDGGVCMNTIGSYYCACQEYLEGDGTINGTSCKGNVI